MSQQVEDFIDLIVRTRLGRGFKISNFGEESTEQRVSNAIALVESFKVLAKEDAKRELLKEIMAKVETLTNMLDPFTEDEAMREAVNEAIAAYAETALQPHGPAEPELEIE